MYLRGFAKSCILRESSATRNVQLHGHSICTFVSIRPKICLLVWVVSMWCVCLSAFDRLSRSYCNIIRRWLEDNGAFNVVQDQSGVDTHPSVYPTIRDVTLSLHIISRLALPPPVWSFALRRVKVSDTFFPFPDRQDALETHLHRYALLPLLHLLYHGRHLRQRPQIRWGTL